MMSEEAEDMYYGEEVMWFRLICDEYESEYFMWGKEKCLEVLGI